MEPKRSPARRPAATADTAKIGFIGAGKLPEAIITGMVRYGKVDPSRIYVAAPSAVNTERLKDSFKGLKTTRTNVNIFGRPGCDIVFIAVNGNVIRNLYKLGGNRPAALTTNYIPNMKYPLYVLSLVTGFDIKCIKEVLLNPENPGKYVVQMHRIMLNCAIAFGKGVGCIDMDPTSAKFPKSVHDLLKPLTIHFEYLAESQMDAAAALAGFGLAYCYFFVSSISDGAVKIGLSRTQAIRWASKTAKCASETILFTNKLPNELKDEVCSPAGGAIYGCTILDKAEVTSAVTNAIEDGYKRARKLAEEGL